MIKIQNESQMWISKCENIFAKSYTSLRKFLWLKKFKNVVDMCNGIIQ